MSRVLPLALSLVMVLPACTWVKMEPGGATVRVAPLAADVSGCTRRGEVGVSVRDKVALYQRNELKVRDELETMARNEAASLDADTVQALNEPSAGEQRFAAYVCGTRDIATRRSATPVQPRAADGAETFPVDGD